MAVFFFIYNPTGTGNTLPEVEGKIIPEQSAPSALSSSLCLSVSKIHSIAPPINTTLTKENDREAHCSEVLLYLQHVRRLLLISTCITAGAAAFVVFGNILLSLSKWPIHHESETHNSSNNQFWSWIKKWQLNLCTSLCCVIALPGIVLDLFCMSVCVSPSPSHALWFTDGWATSASLQLTVAVIDIMLLLNSIIKRQFAIAKGRFCNGLIKMKSSLHCFCHISRVSW